MKAESSARALRRQAFKGLVGFIVLLALLIFVPAGTIDYWQGWAYWTTFVVVTALITIYFLKFDRRLVERRLRAGPTAEPEKTQKVIQGAASVLFIATILVPTLDRRFAWSRVPPLASIAALAIYLVGFFVMFVALRQNSFAASTVQVEPGQQVVSTGLYRVVRHPMYAGGIMSFLATPIALGSWWGLIPAAGLMVAIVVRLLDEERYLLEHLPGYAAYRATTHARLIPWVW